MAAPRGAPNADADEQIRLGFMAALGAYTFWGLFPIFLKAVDSVAALEILGHRILWSVPFGALILFARRQWSDVRAILRSRRTVMTLALTSAIIALNWLVYVWAVTNDRIMEASLGYYINPLMYVAAGVFVFGDRLSRYQIAAVALATIGVVILTIGAGVVPWVSLVLAVSFTAYGFFKKTVGAGAMPGLFIEVLLLSPIAALYMAWIATNGTSAFLAGQAGLDGLLVLAGPVTVIPLVLFAIAARRLTLTTLGFIQYIGPTLQLCCGLLYGETFTVYHAWCFGLIWLALAVISYDAVRRTRMARPVSAPAR